MFSPSASDVHVDALLTNVSIGYKNATYIADQLFPIVPVRKQSGIVPKYDQSHWFRDDAALRAPGSVARGGGWSVDNTDLYACQRYSYKVEIDDETRDNTDAPYNLETEAAEFATDKLLLRRERAWAAAFFTTSVWGDDETGGTDFTQWNNYATSNPLIDLTTYQSEVEGRIGRDANTLTVGREVWDKLKWHPNVVDTIKYTQTGVIGTDLFATMTGFARLFIGRAIYTATVEGTAEASVTYSRVWGKHALVMYVPAAASLMTPAAGYTLVWDRVPGALSYTRRLRNDEREVDIIEANSYFDQKVTAARAGTFLSGAVA